MIKSFFTTPATKKWWIGFSLILAGVWVAIAFVFSFLVSYGAFETTEATNQYGGVKIVAPDDGTLHVGTIDVPQIPGECNQQGCRFMPADPATLPTVVIAPGQGLPVSASRSTSFSTGISSGPRPAADLRIVDGKLVVSPGVTGTWTVTVSGSAQGMWQFNADVVKAK